MKDNNPKTGPGRLKPGIDAVPPSALAELGRVMELGKEKYGHFNWRLNPVSSSTYINAAWRHLSEFIDGRAIDPESKAHVLAHVMACCAIVIDAEHSGTLIDDRGPKGCFDEVVQQMIEDKVAENMGESK